MQRSSTKVGASASGRNGARLLTDVGLFRALFFPVMTIATGITTGSFFLASRRSQLGQVPGPSRRHGHARHRWILDRPGDWLEMTSPTNHGRDYALDSTRRTARHRISRLGFPGETLTEVGDWLEMTSQ